MNVIPVFPNIFGRIIHEQMIYILAISYNCNYVATEKDLSKQEVLLFLIEKLEIHCIKKQA